ncbi:hypothetical protein evm_015079 [Chilo suppressalis]|nr:hypothetical protein evm_015079 [Chilo suppressalis]
MIMFADDSTIIFECKNENDYELSINKDFDKIMKWMQNNKLTVNLDKTKSMTFKQRESKKIIDVKIEHSGKKVEEVNTTKFLGIYIDNNMTWETHCNYVYEKLRKKKTVNLVFFLTKLIMDAGFVKAESTNLPSIDALMVGEFVALNPDFCSAEQRNDKASIASLSFSIQNEKELMEQLSTSDQGKVDELNDAIRRLTQENKEAFSQRMNLEANKNKLENLLTNNLIRRKDELVQALQEISVEDRKRRLANSKGDLNASDKRIKQINKEMEEVEKKVQSAVKNEKALKMELDKWRNKEKEAQDKMEEDAKGLEKMASKEVLLQEKIQESLDKIAALGTLPNAPELHAKYQKLSLKQLFKELEKANQHLKKYNHVNKKALDQFISFSEQKEKLYKRKEELDIGGEKIRELIETLEHRKLEAIQFTFRQVSKNFTEVFKKLVPQGRGSLIMRTGADDAGELSAENRTQIAITHQSVKEFSVTRKRIAHHENWR